MRSRVAVLAALLSLIPTAHAGTVHILSCTPVDATGKAIVPRPGETYYVGVPFDVIGSFTGGFSIRVTDGYGFRQTPVLTEAAQNPGRHTVAWGPFVALSERPQKIAAEVVLTEPSRDAGTSAQASFTPSLSGRGIETYDAQRLTGSIGTDITLARRSSNTKLQWWLPVPPELPYQRPEAARLDGALVSLLNPYAGRLDRPTGDTAGVSLAFTATSSSVRINPTELRKVNMSAVRVLPWHVGRWTRPETLIESGDSRIVRFARRALPADYTRKPVYDVAQSLYRAVVAQVDYEAPGNQRPSALKALETGRGDCGFFSALFVAACRTVGIPARAVCGLEVGTDVWHVWAEFYIPTQGWVPVDPTYSNSVRSDGSEALYFGVVPNLNQRVAVSVGFDHLPGDQKVPMLQTPAGWLTGNTLRTSDVKCQLSIAPKSPAP